MRDDRGQRHVQPEGRTGTLRMQQHQGCDAHQCAIARALSAVAVPGRHALFAIAQELLHGLADAEDFTRGEAGRKVVRVQPPAFEQALERPERELTVVRGQSYPMTRGSAVRQVVADFAVARLALLDRQAFGPSSMPRIRLGATGPLTGSRGPCSRADRAGRNPSEMTRAARVRFEVMIRRVSQTTGRPRGRPTATDPSARRCRRVAG